MGLFQKATQVYLWALPLINTVGMKTGSEKLCGAGYNVLPIWKKRIDAKTLITIHDSNVIYAMRYVDLGKDGPPVFDAPPHMQHGILLDFWQRPVPVDGGKFSETSVCPVPTAKRAVTIECAARLPIDIEPAPGPRLMAFPRLRRAIRGFGRQVAGAREAFRHRIRG